MIHYGLDNHIFVQIFSQYRQEPQQPRRAWNCVKTNQQLVDQISQIIELNEPLHFRLEQVVIDLTSIVHQNFQRLNRVLANGLVVMLQMFDALRR